jgi:hypothetical protein
MRVIIEFLVLVVISSESTHFSKPRSLVLQTTTICHLDSWSSGWIPHTILHLPPTLHPKSQAIFYDTKLIKIPLTPLLSFSNALHWTSGSTKPCKTLHDLTLSLTFSQTPLLFCVVTILNGRKHHLSLSLSLSLSFILHDAHPPRIPVTLLTP